MTIKEKNMRNINKLEEELDFCTQEEIVAIETISMYVEKLIGYSKEYNFSDYLHSFEEIYDLLEITGEYSSLRTLAASLLHDLQRAMENYVSVLETQYPQFKKTGVDGKIVFDIASAEKQQKHELKQGLITCKSLHINDTEMMILSKV